MTEAVTGAGLARPGIVRDALTWHLYLFFGFFQFLVNVQGNVVPFLKEELGFSYRVAGLHLSGFAVGAGLVGLAGYLVTRRLGRKAMLVFGVGGMAVAGLLLCLAGSPAESIGSTVLMGLASGFIISIAYPVLAEIHGRAKDIAFGEINAVCYGFGIAAPLLTGIVVSLGLGWRTAIVVDAVFGLALLASFARLGVPEAPVRAAERGERLPLLYWTYWLSLAFGISLEFCALFWAPTYLEKVIGLDAASAASLAAAFAIAMFLGRAIGSRLVRTMTPAAILFGAYALQAIGFLLYFFAGGAVVAVAGLFILGLGVSVLFPLLFALAIGAAGKATDLASARSLLAGSAAVLTMPAALGALADLVGLHQAHAIMPVLIAATAGVFLAGRAIERRRAYSSSSS